MGRRRAFATDREEVVGRRARLVEPEVSLDDANPLHGELLRLQRGGGNGAVAGVLARDETVAENAPPPPRKYGPEELKPAKPKTMKIEGVGEIPLLSVSTPAKDSYEVTVIIDGNSPFVAELQRRAGAGAGLGKVVIDFGYMTWTLDSTYIGSFELSSGTEPTVSLKLNYQSLSLDTTVGQKPGQVD